MDLSTVGVENFCRDAAPRYGKTEEELRGLSLMDLATCYMWNERRRLLREMTQALSVPTPAPILVIADKADFGNRSHRECSILSGGQLSEILSCREGLSTTFFSDGQDIRCEDITENGTNFYLFREVTSLKGFHEFTSMVNRGEAFTQSQLDQCTRSLMPQVHQLLGWPAEEEKQPLEEQIRQARSTQQNKGNQADKQPVPMER